MKRIISLTFLISLSSVSKSMESDLYYFAQNIKDRGGIARLQKSEKNGATTYAVGFCDGTFYYVTKKSDGKIIGSEGIFPIIGFRGNQPVARSYPKTIALNQAHVAFMFFENAEKTPAT